MMVYLYIFSKIFKLFSSIAWKSYHSVQFKNKVQFSSVSKQFQLSSL